MTVTTRAVGEALEELYDPELGVNVVALGLIYGIEASHDGIRVEMTTTTLSCPMGEAMMEAAGRILLLTFPGVPVSVDFVGDPPWDVGMCSQEARDWLGIPAGAGRHR
ncbi:MAG: metal-sulfur cluster assembly factor [Gemmataceae bacterium]|nr:metal-sulfur cluster assembly factor [Gemmataceae bacterium]